MTDGILVGIGGTVGAIIVVGLASLVARQWRSPKRIDRIERVLPAFARALLALLQVHVAEETNGAIKEAEDELRHILTESVISQRERK